MHWITLSGIIMIALGTLLTYYGRFLTGKEGNEKLSTQITEQKTTITKLEGNNTLLLGQVSGLETSNQELLGQNSELIEVSKDVQKGNKELIGKNSELLTKIENYQDEIRKKDERIRQLEEKAKKVSRGNISTIQFDGSYLVRRGGSMSVTGGTDETKIYQQFNDLEKQKKFSEIIRLADNQIISNPDWLTPYLFKASALLNRGKREEAMNLLEYVENQAPSDHQYTLALMQLYIGLGNQNKASQLLSTLPKEVQVDIQNQMKRNNKK